MKRQARPGTRPGDTSYSGGKQEDLEFKDSLGNLVRTDLKRKGKKSAGLCVAQ